MLSFQGVLQPTFNECYRFYSPPFGISVCEKEGRRERERTGESKREFVCVCMRVWVCPSNRVRKFQAVNRKAKLWSRA